MVWLKLHHIAKALCITNKGDWKGQQNLENIVIHFLKILMFVLF